MDKKQKAFMSEVNKLAVKFKALVEDHGYQHDIVSNFFVAFFVDQEVETFSDDEEDVVDVYVTCYMNAGSQEDVDMIKDNVQKAFDSSNDPLTDLLNGTGIYLN